MCKQREPVRGLGTGKDQRLYSKRNMVHGTLQYAGVTYNPTLWRLQSRLQIMYDGNRATLCQSRPWHCAWDDFIPSQGPRIWPKNWVFSQFGSVLGKSHNWGNRTENWPGKGFESWMNDGIGVQRHFSRINLSSSCAAEWDDRWKLQPIQLIIYSVQLHQTINPSAKLNKTKTLLYDEAGNRTWAGRQSHCIRLYVGIARDIFFDFFCS
jgi:hypothetical protein